MPEFLKLIPPLQAKDLFLNSLTLETDPEMVDTDQSLHRVIAEDISAHHPLPEFARSTVDGYACRAEDTYGAAESLPAYLRLIGEVPMGAAAQYAIQKGDSVVIHTGGMIPEGANAVVMLENTQQTHPGEIEITRAAAVGENIIRIGEDVAAGELVIPVGTRLRPAEIGGLMALGITRVAVKRMPRVGILSSGDEVVPPSRTPGPGQVRDINAHTLAALVRETGGQPINFGIVPDDWDALMKSARQAFNETDILVITAGSSASARDLTASVIQNLGKPGVLVHGVNIRPGKPTILAICDSKPVIGLPGNPVSALVIAGLFVKPVIEKVSGLRVYRPQPRLPAVLTINVPSQAGREDWVAVRLVDGEAGRQAIPVFGKSNLIFTLSRADGMIKIPSAANGLLAGEVVDVYLY